MKTSISLSDDSHRALRRLALDRRTTMARLIEEAVQEKFLSSPALPLSEPSPPPLSRLYGSLKTHQSTARDLQKLKSAWRPRP